MISALPTLFGPLWFGLQRSPYWLVLGWAIISSAWWLWRTRHAMIAAVRQGGEITTASVAFPISLAVVVSAGFIAAHFAIYYFVMSPSWFLGAVTALVVCMTLALPFQLPEVSAPLGRVVEIDESQFGLVLDRLAQKASSFLIDRLPPEPPQELGLELPPWEGLRDGCREAGIVMAFMVVALVAAKRRPQFIGSKEQLHLETIAAGRLTLLLAKDIPGPNRRARAIGAAAREFNLCLSAVARVISNFVSGSKNPVDPIFSFINRRVPIVIGERGAESTPDQRSQVYAPLFRDLYEIADGGL